MVSALPFDDFRKLLADLPEGDAAAEQTVRDIFALHGTAAELAGIADLGAWLARWSGRPPRILRPLVAIFAGSHGVTCQLAADAQREAMHATIERLRGGDEPVNRACAAGDIGLKVFELALDLPTGDISTEAALDERDCAATMAFGMEAIAGGADLLGLGGLGTRGSAVTAAAVILALGRGADAGPRLAASDPAFPAREMERIEAALALHRGHLDDPLEVLRRLGSREIAAIAGAILAARAEKVPVILEGAAALAAAAVLHAANARALLHCRLAGFPDGGIFAAAAAGIGLDALLNMRIGTSAGTGAAMAAGLLKTVASACPAPAAS